MKSSLLFLIVLLLLVTSFAFFVISSSSPVKASSSSDNKSMRKSLRGGTMSVFSTASSSSSLPSSIPSVLYGTAWKKEATSELVELSIRTGFRAIDTANQPKHYHESGVGDAVKKLIDEGVIKRSDLFLQTKYTPIGGQDPNNIPYDPNEPVNVQVEQSFAKSLQNLQTDYLDSLVLHSPMKKLSDTIIVWKQFEEIHKRGGVRVSN